MAVTDGTTTKIRPYIKIQGHVLQAHGGAHDKHGKKRENPATDKHRRTKGHALCSCGEMSGDIWGNRHRKEWFEQHKKELFSREEYEKTCSKCSESKIVHHTDKTKSDFYIYYPKNDYPRPSSQCKKCDRSRYHGVQRVRKTIEKNILISAKTHEALRKVAYQKDVNMNEISNKALRFYLENICPIKQCANLSRNGYSCQSCSEKRYNVAS